MYNIWQIWNRLAGFYVEYLLRLKFIKIITWKSPCNYFSHCPKSCIMGITDIVAIGIQVEIVSLIAKIKIKTTSTVTKSI